MKKRELIERLLALHSPHYEVNGEWQTTRVLVTTEDLPDGHECVMEGWDLCAPDEDEHYVLACSECRVVVEDVDGYLLWPCPTAKLLTAEKGSS